MDVEDLPSWTAILTISPDIGTSQTIFKPHIQIQDSSGAPSIESGYLYRVNYTADSNAVSVWLDSIPHSTLSFEPGEHTLVVVIQDTLGFLDTTSCKFYVQPLLQITPTNTSGHSQGNIDWSNDGSNRIAFDAYGGEAGANQSIFIVQYPDGEPVKVSFNPDSGNYFFDQFPEWSPQGDKIACASSNGLDIIDLSTHERTNLDPDGQYEMRSWSPDGRWLVYWDGPGRTVIHDFNMDTTGVLFDEQYFITWSPDGSKIARCNHVRNRREYLQIIDLNSREVVDEFEIPTHGWKIEWSPVRNLISLGFSTGGQSGFILNLESGVVFSFKPDGLLQSWYPSWSEDGSLLAFESKINAPGVWTSIWAIEFPDEIE